MYKVVVFPRKTEDLQKVTLSCENEDFSCCEHISEFESIKELNLNVK